VLMQWHQKQPTVTEAKLTQVIAPTTPTTHSPYQVQVRDLSLRLHLLLKEPQGYEMLLAQQKVFQTRTSITTVLYEVQKFKVALLIPISKAELQSTWN